MRGRLALLVAFLATLIGIWQLLAMAEIWPPYTLPSPASVFSTLWDNTESGRIPQALVVSMRRLIVGYTISLGIGIGIGTLSGSVRQVDETLGTIVLGLQSLPSIAWLPLAVLWFGLNEQAIIFVVLMGSLFSVAVSARSGVRNIPPLLMRTGQTYGAAQWQMYRYIVLPGMMPSIVQGLKLGWSFAWRSLMAGELLVAGLGIGQMLNMGRDLNDMSLVLAVMLVIVAVGLTVDRLVFGRIEAWVQERWGLVTS
ncbi:MAG: ABC transporter permease [Chloroflexi bacterium]|nr:ABC transporter permease [Chloroflexota bacterium]